MRRLSYIIREGPIQSQGHFKCRRRRQKARVRKDCEDATLLALETGKRATAKECRGRPEDGGGKEPASHLEPAEGMSSANTLTLAQ